MLITCFNSSNDTELSARYLVASKYTRSRRESLTVCGTHRGQLVERSEINNENKPSINKDSVIFLQRYLLAGSCQLSLKFTRVIGSTQDIPYSQKQLLLSDVIAQVFPSPAVSYKLKDSVLGGVLYPVFSCVPAAHYCSNIDPSTTIRIVSAPMTCLELSFGERLIIGGRAFILKAYFQFRKYEQTSLSNQ